MQPAVQNLPPPSVAQPSPATLFGHGAFHTQSGSRGSCAGFSVALMADTPRMRERMMALYGSTLRAMAPISLVKSRSAKLAGDNDDRLVGSAQCDAHGAFTFPDLPAGSYFLIARVVVAPPRNGERDYVIMRNVDLRRGEARDVTLAP
jgi:hypothetical protein